MDITIEGFHSWMWRGLSFLIPFLFTGYIFQAYNSYALYKLSSHPDAPWQVSVLSVLFFILFVGNAVTTLSVIPEKIRTRVKEHYRLLTISKQKKVQIMLTYHNLNSEKSQTYLCWSTSTNKLTCLLCFIYRETTAL